MSRLKLLLLLVMSIGLWQVAAAATDTGTLLVGTGPVNSCGGRHSIGHFGKVPVYWGFTKPRALGSYSPVGLTGGEAVIAIWEFNPYCSGTGSLLVISGFSANLGKNWLTSVTCNGVTKTGDSARYGYRGNFVEWVWHSGFGLILASGLNVRCTIVHR